MFFDLKGLFVDIFGFNLRNFMVYGLFDDEDFLSFLMFYLWWVMLRLCYLFLFIY